MKLEMIEELAPLSGDQIGERSTLLKEELLQMLGEAELYWFKR
jgi:hypothetical protein